MKYQDHCKESIHKFGKPFEDVHLWLDEFAGKPGIGMKHRQKRHHVRGIEEVRRKWGDQAAMAARQHIIADLKEEGWKESDHFPYDEADYVRMGLF